MRYALLTLLLLIGCSSDVSPLQDGIYPTVCPVHAIATKSDVLDISYGMPAPTLPQFRVIDSTLMAAFPETVDEVGGGCTPGKYTKAEVLYCPECRKGAYEYLSALTDSEAIAQYKWQIDILSRLKR